MKPLVWAISALTLSMLCIAAAIVWNGRIQTHATPTSLVIVDRWTDTVRVCGTNTPSRYTQPTKEAVMLTCGTPDKPIWASGDKTE